MWPIEPNMLWEFAMTKYSKSDAAKELIELRTYLPVAEIISNSYFSDLANLIHNEYTHFKHFSDYAKEAMKLGIEQHHFSRLIVLNSSDNWTITDETKLGLELIKLLNGHLDCWVGYKNVVKERTKILTDYVYFCDGTIMDYYEESCTLIVNDLDHSHKDQFNFSEFSESVTDGKIRNIIKLDQFQRENNL